jgi:hypothetical protein
MGSQKSLEAMAAHYGLAHLDENEAREGLSPMRLPNHASCFVRIST